MQRRRMFKQGMSILILMVFALLVSGCLALAAIPLIAVETAVEAKQQKQQEAEQQQQKQREQQEAAKKAEQEQQRLAVERARGYIEVMSDVAGTVLLSGKVTTHTVASGNTETLTIENANGEYEVAVRDSNGKVWQANKIINFKGGGREIALVEDPKYVTSPSDFTYIQNTSGGLTITRYNGKHRKLIIPETISGVRVTEIGENAVNALFEDRNLVSLVIPNSVTSIGDGAFKANALSSLIIPNSVTTIGNEAFMSCKLTSLILGSRVTSIGESAFAVNKLTTITIPNSVTSIGRTAFADNELTTITIPNNVTFIDALAFADNPITTIVIPPSLANNDFGRAFSTAAWSKWYGSRTYFYEIRDQGLVSNATSITLPANVTNWNLTTNFDQSLVNYYISQNKRAGTYTQENGIWKLTQATTQAPAPATASLPRFIVAPSGFNSGAYSRVDLFEAAAEAEKMIRGDGGPIDAVLAARKFVSDVVFVNQEGTYIQFRTADNAISRYMKIDSRAGLSSGQRIRLYYTITKNPLTIWTVDAIERL